MPVALAALVSILIAAAAWRLRALSPDGAVAAAVVGTAILWPTGWPGCAVLGVYFVGSTLVSRLAAAATGPSEQAETEIRTARQVGANGGWAAIGALTDFATPGLGLWLATIGLAASGADTWATAFGSLSPRPPRDLLRLRVVERGASGGVTWFGSSGGFVGAALIGLTATAAGGPPGLFLAAALVGGGAMLLDSALGSAIQARFHCPACDLPTERRRHRCGRETIAIRGPAWLDNDAVNAIMTGLALVAGWLIHPG